MEDVGQEMSAGEYHGDPCPTPSLSASIAHVLISDSPAHARLRHPRLVAIPEKEEAEHFDIGTAAHALLLEGSKAVEIIDATDWRTKVARDGRDAARAAGKVPILSHKWQAVQDMVDAAITQLDAHRDARDAFLVGHGLPEQTLTWIDRVDVWCRARVDWLHKSQRKIFDYKTTSATANPDVLSRTMFSNGYDVQAAFYLRGLAAVTGQPIDQLQFRFVFQETYPPYALSVMALGPGPLMLAEKKVLYALDLWRKCLATDNWPAYPTQTCDVMLPEWEEKRWIAKELRSVNAV